jgi:NAD(P)-dependent dehydrogenase (short-subunit alcohol dehydrogenase family)
MNNSAETILITGAGSGMGLETALFLASKGYRVFGGILTEAEGEALLQEAAKRSVVLTPLVLDVTDGEAIRNQVAHVLGETGRIDGLIHFAGLGLRGFFEDLSMQEIRRVYDVNVFGAMELTQAVLPSMRQHRRGRIVITSSAAGRMGSMSIGGYSSSKFALEGFAECLAQEVRPFDIFVSLLEPGLIQTPHFTINRNRARRATDPSSPYYPWFCQHEHLVDGILARNRFTTQDVARLVHCILTARRPKLRYLIGANAKVVLWLRRYIPGEWFDRFYWPILRKMVTSPRNRVTTLSGK